MPKKLQHKMRIEKKESTKQFLTCSGRRSQERLRRAKKNGTSFFLTIELYVPIYGKTEMLHNAERMRIVQKINGALENLRRVAESENGIMKSYNGI